MKPTELEELQRRTLYYQTQSMQAMADLIEQQRLLIKKLQEEKEADAR